VEIVLRNSREKLGKFEVSSRKGVTDFSMREMRAVVSFADMVKRNQKWKEYILRLLT
jgi:hypothetical protein